jgi:uncharacterized protein
LAQGRGHAEGADLVSTVAGLTLEGIVTTLAADGSVHIAAMGPEVSADSQRLVLKPFQTSQTYRNLERHPEAVFHVTDDVLLLAQAAIGQIDPVPATVTAQKVRGSYLRDSCRYLEFRIVACDVTQTRTRLEAEVLHVGRLRDFFGFNRAKHAVVEAAILATRTHLVPLEQIAKEFERLEVLVQKTGGSAEFQAFALLRDYLAHVTSERINPSSCDRERANPVAERGKHD